MKKVLTWSPFVNSGEKPTGSFRMKTGTKTDKTVEMTVVNPTTKDSITSNYFVTSQLSGKLVWIDKIETKYGNKFRILLSTPNGLHQIDTDFNTDHLNGVLNVLKKGLKDDNYQLRFAVYPRKDASGNVKVKDGKQVFAKHLQLEGEGFFTKDNPKPESLKWVQKTTAKGKEWDNSAELVFWEEVIVDVQTELITKGVAVPFSYGSLIFTNVQNQYGRKNISADIVERGVKLYESVKGNYQYAMSKKIQTNADDFFNEDFSQEEPQSSVASSVPLSTTVKVAGADDLPF